MTGEGTALARVEDIDRRDESQIMRHMSGEMVTEYVYKFKDGRGRTQKGLSWAGTRELASLLGSIEVESNPEIELRDEGDGKGAYWRVVCRATDRRRGLTVLGGTHEHVTKPRKGGGTYEDQNAFQVALSKAQRNAIKNLVPVSIVHTLIEDMERLAEGRISVGAMRGVVDAATGEIHEGQARVAAEDPSTGSGQTAKQMPMKQPSAKGGQLNASTLSQFWASAANIGVSVEDVGALIGEKPTADSIAAYLKREDMSGLRDLLARLKEIKSR